MVAEFITNITKFSLYKSTTEYAITNVKEVKYSDSNRYVKIVIPYASAYKRQQIKPQELIIQAVCLDSTSLLAAINGVGRDSSFTKCVITGVNSAGSTKTYTFTTCYIESIAGQKFTEKLGLAEFLLQISADSGPT